MKPLPSNASSYHRTPEFGEAGVVEPQVPHEVEPLGPVRFFVEFLRVAEEPAS